MTTICVARSPISVTGVTYFGEVGHVTDQDRDHDNPKAMANVGEVVDLHRVGMGTSPHVPERYPVVAAAGYYAASTRFAGF